MIGSISPKTRISLPFGHDLQYGCRSGFLGGTALSGTNGVDMVKDEGGRMKDEFDGRVARP